MNTSEIRNSKSEITKVLVVDDSSFMRKSLTYILESDAYVKVIDTAADGEDAVRKTRELHPDVVLLDLEMPGMDGFTALKYIMGECPTPVLVVSALNKRDPSVAIKCLEYGAIDFISKPSGVISYDIDKIRDEIVAKVKTAACVDVKKLKTDLRGMRFQREWPRHTRKGIVVIGASTGGPRSVLKVLSGLPRNIPAVIFIVQHITREFIPYLADRFRWGSDLEVAVADDGDILSPGRVFVAPGIKTVIAKEGNQKKIKLIGGTYHEFNSCAITSIMESVAGAYGDGALGVLLTGMGSDGSKGMKAIKDAGGSTIAEDQSTCVVFGMPRVAIEMGCVDRIVPLPEIAQTIMEMI